MRWTRQIHLGWKEWNGLSEEFRQASKMMSTAYVKKWQYVRDRYSIIQIRRDVSSPISCLRHLPCPDYTWELYDGENTRTFKTLKAAQQYADMVS